MVLQEWWAEPPPGFQKLSRGCAKIAKNVLLLFLLLLGEPGRCHASHYNWSSRPSVGWHHRGVLGFQTRDSTLEAKWGQHEHSPSLSRANESKIESSPNNLDGRVIRQHWNFLLTLKETICTIRAFSRVMNPLKIKRNLPSEIVPAPETSLCVLHFANGQVPGWGDQRSWAPCFPKHRARWKDA